MDSSSTSLKCGQLLAGANPPDYGVFCNSEEFSDLKLTVGETTYFGHRIVLATASEVFQTMLSSVGGLNEVHFTCFSYFLALVLIE